MEVYEIDLLRALFVDKLNDSSIFLASFYEQTQDQEQISRYVDTIRDLIALQNREKSESDYKAMGIISQSGDAEILNIKTNYIVPTGYQVRLDIELSDRDYVLQKIKTLINELRGRKFELILLDDGSVKVITQNTINTTSNKLEIRLGGTSLGTQPNFMKVIGSYNPTTATTDWSTDIDNQFHNYGNGTPFSTTGVPAGFWFVYNSKLYYRTLTLASVSPATYTYGTAVEVDDVSGQFKMSLSFNGVQSQEPYINNGLDRVFLFFGGNVTITDQNVMLGNDIVKTTIQVGKNTGTLYDVEPNEIPASLGLDTDGYNEWSTGYRGKERIIGVANKLSYTFIYDTSIALYDDLYAYSRYGEGASTYANQIFTIKEYRYSYGVLKVNTFYAKLGETNTSNTNGDVMTINVAFNVGAY
jgi:hypothetical protein